MSSETPPNEAVAEGQAALDFCDMVLPLLYKQHNLLGIINTERHARHQELRNKGITQRKFKVGDLVIIRKQVKSSSAAGIATKIMFKAKGPYQVIQQERPGSYKL